jgi:pimeloyl-ACP methyl ester carboxylesterase
MWFSALVSPTDVLILAEYPGYGACPGTPTEATILQAADHLLREALRRWSAAPVTVVGESLGSGVGCRLAAREGVARLALISPFSSASDVASYHYSFLPVRALMRDRFDSVQAVRGVRVPLHIVHSTCDTVIPDALARRLFRAYPYEVKAFTELPGFGHNDLARAVVDSAVAAQVRDFLSH